MENENKTPLQEFLESEKMYNFEFEIEHKIIPKPLVWKDIDNFRFSDDRWLVKNLIPKEGVTIFASVSGEGKSLLVMHLAKCISEGTPWFGYEGFSTKQSKVLYINLEMSVSEIQRRGRKIGFNIENNNLVILNEDDLNLNDKRYTSDDVKFKWLLKYIHENQVKVVIVDTLRGVSGGLKENEAEAVREFFQKFMVLKNSGVSIIFLDHTKKASHLEGKIPKKEWVLGSQDKTANAESLIMIYKHESSGNIHVYQRKNRLGEEIKPFAVKISDIAHTDGKEGIEFQYIGDIDDDVNKKEEAKGLLLGILADGLPKDRKELGELTKKNVGDKNLRAGLKDLLETGDLDFFKQGKRHMYFIPTEKPSELKESVVPNKDENF